MPSPVSNVTPPSLAGSPYVGSTMSCSTGTWSGGSPPYSYVYQWKRSGSNIAGATSSSYTLTDSDDGHSISCTVTAFDQLSQSASASTGSVTVYQPAAPAGGSMSVSGSLTVGSTLTISTSGWLYMSGYNPSYSYLWYSGGVLVGTSSTYTLTTGDDGKLIAAKATATNDVGSTTISTSVGTVKQPSAPTGGTCTVTGGTAVGDTLTASTSGWSYMDGYNPSYSYKWKHGGTVLGTGNTYTIQDTDAGTTITCTVTATNDAGSASATSGNVSVDYTIPVNTTPPAASGTTSVGYTLTCSTGAWTQRPTSYSYQWQRDNSGGGTYSDIVGATSSTYMLVFADDGCNIRCVVTATNPAGSTPANSNSLGLVVAPPLNTVAPVVSGTQVVGQTLSTTNGTWDYVPTSYSYAWLRDNQGDGNFSLITGANSSTYTLTYDDLGCQVKAQVTAHNADGAGNATSTATVRLPGTPVLATSAVLFDSDLVPYIGGTLTCTEGTWTAYPAPSFSYQWQSSPDETTWSDIVGATSRTIKVTQTYLHNYIRCIVTADNGY